jgi:tetratricopeptide (TPR) repeat protein
MKTVFFFSIFFLLLTGCTEQFNYDRAKLLFDKADIRNKNGNTGDLNAALDQINEVVKADDKNAEAWELCGEINSSLQNYLNAKIDFSKAVELKPQWADAFLMRSMTEYALKDFSFAIKDADEAMALNLSTEHVPVALYYKGKSRWETGDQKGACDDLELAKKKGFSLANSEIEKYCR